MSAGNDKRISNRPAAKDNDGKNESLSRTMSMRSNANGKTQLVLRMSTNATSNITRAKSRTLRLTIVIVVSRKIY